MPMQEIVLSNVADNLSSPTWSTSKTYALALEFRRYLV